eukprot:5519771-Pleurochrysis_carterae.AAC.2
MASRQAAATLTQQIKTSSESAQTKTAVALRADSYEFEYTKLDLRLLPSLVATVTSQADSLCPGACHALQRRSVKRLYYCTLVAAQLRCRTIIIISPFLAHIHHHPSLRCAQSSSPVPSLRIISITRPFVAHNHHQLSLHCAKSSFLVRSLPTITIACTVD